MKRLLFWICLLGCCYVTAQSIIRPPSGTLRIEGHLVVTNRTSGLATNIIDALNNIAGGTATNAMVSFNGLTNAYQTLDVGTNGTDVAIVSIGAAHTLNLPTASGANRGAVSTADFITFSNKLGTIAANTITTVMILDETILTADLAVSSVTLPKLGANAVDSSKIVDSSITGTDILNGTITSLDLASQSVTSAAIEDATVALADLASNSVDAAKIVDGAVGTAEIADGTVALADLATDSVSSVKIVDRNVADADIEYAVTGVTSSAGTLTFNLAGSRRQTNSESGAITIAISNKPTTGVDRWVVAQFTPATTLTLTWPTTVSGSVARWIPDATNAVTSIAAGEFREIAIGWNGVQVLFADMCPAVGGGTVDYASVTNALALTGATTTWLRSDGTQTTPPGGTVDYASVTNALAFTGSTNTFLRSDGTQVAPAGTVSYTTVTNALSLTGSTATYLRSDGTQSTPAGGGDVTAAANLTDNYAVRGDGGVKGVQTSLLGITDTGSLTIGDASQASVSITGSVTGTDPVLTLSASTANFGTAAVVGGSFSAANASNGGFTTGPTGNFIGGSAYLINSLTNGYTTLTGLAGTNFYGLRLGPATTTNSILLRATNGTLRVMNGNETLMTALEVLGQPYDAAAYDGSLRVVTQDDFRDKVESMSGGGGSAPVGTVINTTTPVVLYELLRAKDTTGTNAEPAMLTYDNATLILGTNSAAPTSKRITGSVPTGANTAGTSLSIASPSGTGTGAGGSLLFQTSPAGGSSSVTNAAVTRLTIDSTGLSTFSGNVTVPSLALGSSAVLSWGIRGRLTATADGHNLFCNNNANGYLTLQLGPDDAAPDASVNVRAANGVGTDIIGGDIKLTGGAPTGTGAGGDVMLQTAPSAKSTGSSSQTPLDRYIVVGKGKVLTDGAAVSLFEVALPTLKMAGGTMEATVSCTDGTDMQSYTQTIRFTATNKGGVYTTDITPDTQESKSCPTGTLTTAWTILTGTNKITIQLNADTSLTPSSNAFTVYYTITNNSEQAITLL